MSEDTNQPGMKDAIDEQAALIVYLQKRLRETCDRNSAQDANQFAQAALAAAQTWKLLVDEWEKIKPKPATSIVQTVHPASIYQADPTRRKAP